MSLCYIMHRRRNDAMLSTFLNEKLAVKQQDNAKKYTLKYHEIELIRMLIIKRV